MKDIYSKPKFAFEISEEQQSRALRCFPEYGMRKAIMSPILDEVMDMIEEHGFIVLGVLLDKGTSIRKVIPSLREAERKSGGT